MTRRAGALAALLGLLAALAAAGPAPAQARAEPDERAQFLEGTHAFRRVLFDLSKRHALKPLTEADARTDPTRTLIVVLGNPAPLSELEQRLGGGRINVPGLTELRAFVQRGGSLLVATEWETPPVLERSFGVRVTGDLPTLKPQAAGEGYRGMRECPFIEAIDNGPYLFKPRWPARGAEPPRVASNHPSCLLRTGGAVPLKFLAALPAGLTTNGRGPPSRDFAAGGQLGAGRALIVADRDVFINEMLLQLDNGNLDFATRTADWLLTAPDGKRRDQIIYYEEGVVRTDFDIPLKQQSPPPLPPPETMKDLVNDLLLGMEEDGTFRRMEEEDRANGLVEDVIADLPLWERLTPERKVWKFVLLAVTLLLGLYGFVRLGVFRHRPDTSAPTLAALLEKHAPAGALLEQRQQALLRAGNLWEAARELARHLFVSAGLDPETAGAVPAVEVRGNWWRRWRARRALAALWRLAHSGPVPVSRRRFARLAAQVKELQAALAAGTVRILP
jgi:hypothetical protein